MPLTFIQQAHNVIPLFTSDFHPTHMHMLQRVRGDWCSASWALGFCGVLSQGSCWHDAVGGPLGHGVCCGVWGGSRGPELAVFCWRPAGSVRLERSNQFPGWIIDSDAQNREHVSHCPYQWFHGRGQGALWMVMCPAGPAVIRPVKAAV